MKTNPIASKIKTILKAKKVAKTEQHKKHGSFHVYLQESYLSPVVLAQLITNITRLSANSVTCSIGIWTHNNIPFLVLYFDYH